jgi:hypothetical protein
MSPRQAAPTMRKAVPWKAVRMRKTKKETRFGARAVPILKAKKRTADMRHTYSCVRRGCRRREGRQARTHLLPYTLLSGPQKHGEIPMKSMYMALDKLMTLPLE